MHKPISLKAKTAYYVRVADRLRDQRGTKNDSQEMPLSEIALRQIAVNISRYDELIVTAKPFAEELDKIVLECCNDGVISDGILKDSSFEIFECAALIFREATLRQPAETCEIVPKEHMRYFETCGQWPAEHHTDVTAYYYYIIPEKTNQK